MPLDGKIDRTRINTVRVKLPLSASPCTVSPHIIFLNNWIQHNGNIWPSHYTLRQKDFILSLFISVMYCVDSWYTISVKTALIDETSQAKHVSAEVVSGPLAVTWRCMLFYTSLPCDLEKDASVARINLQVNVFCPRNETFDWHGPCCRNRRR